MVAWLLTPFKLAAEFGSRFSHEGIIPGVV
jgi:hypothetical protein